MSLKRDNFVRQENSKPSVFAKLVIGRINAKNSGYRKREAKINSDCYFLVFILCICIVLILLKYLILILVTDIFIVLHIGYFLAVF